MKLEHLFFPADLRHASCFEEFDVLLTLHGLAGIESRRRVYDAMTVCSDCAQHYAIATESGLFWISRDTLQRIPTPKTSKSIIINRDSHLKSLAGFPTMIAGDLVIFNEGSFTTLVGSPTHITGSFLCDVDSLSSLKGIPAHIYGDLDVHHCKHLCPDEEIPSLHVGGDVMFPHAMTRAFQKAFKTSRKSLGTNLTYSFLFEPNGDRWRPAHESNDF